MSATRSIKDSVPSYLYRYIRSYVNLADVSRSEQALRDDTTEKKEKRMIARFYSTFLKQLFEGESSNVEEVFLRFPARQSYVTFRRSKGGVEVELFGALSGSYGRAELADFAGRYFYLRGGDTPAYCTCPHRFYPPGPFSPTCSSWNCMNLSSARPKPRFELKSVRERGLPSRTRYPNGNFTYYNYFIKHEATVDLRFVFEFIYKLFRILKSDLKGGPLIIHVRERFDEMLLNEFFIYNGERFIRIEPDYLKLRDLNLGVPSGKMRFVSNGKEYFWNGLFHEQREPSPSSSRRASRTATRRSSSRRASRTSTRLST